MIARCVAALSLAAAPALVAGSASAPARAPTPPLVVLVGQKLVVRMDGTTPSASLLDRARRGQIGGVIVHRFNFASRAQLRSITAKLQSVAAAGGQPPLLIAVDQEGGPVRTVPSLPPTAAPAAMDSAQTARTQGRLTGAALRSLGVNTNLAPVADVPARGASFLQRQGRTWSSSAVTTARLANAFAAGLGDRRALATMKHFPGLGLATRNTDKYVVRISATRRELAPGLRPFRAAVGTGVPLIMLSNAVYDAYDRRNGAGWSRPIATRLLRGELGFRGVSITDSLDGSANARGLPTDVLAVRAAAAGTDLILVTGSEAASRSVYSSLVRAAQDGRIDREDLVASYRRIIALKSRLQADRSRITPWPNWSITFATSRSSQVSATANSSGSRATSRSATSGRGRRRCARGT